MSKKRVNLRSGRPNNDYRSSEIKYYPPSTLYCESQHRRGIYEKPSAEKENKRFSRMPQCVAFILEQDTDSPIVKRVSELALKQLARRVNPDKVFTRILLGLWNPIKCNDKEIILFKCEILEIANAICDQISE